MNWLLHVAMSCQVVKNNEMPVWDLAMFCIFNLSLTKQLTHLHALIEWFTCNSLSFSCMEIMGGLRKTESNRKIR